MDCILRCVVGYLSDHASDARLAGSLLADEVQRAMGFHVFTIAKLGCEQHKLHNAMA